MPEQRRWAATTNHPAIGLGHQGLRTEGPSDECLTSGHEPGNYDDGWALNAEARALERGFLIALGDH